MVETLRAVAHPWLCDVNKHLNTRYYQGFFDDAAMHLYAHCGFTSKSEGMEEVGVADVKCTFEYKKEVPPGALIVVHSGFIRLGNKSMVSIHHMRPPGSQEVIATCETVTVFLDLQERRSLPMPESFRKSAQGMLIGTADSH